MTHTVIDILLDFVVSFIFQLPVYTFCSITHVFQAGSKTFFNHATLEHIVFVFRVFHGC